MSSENLSSSRSLSSDNVVFHASLSIAVKPTKHYSYSSGSRSSMYLLILCLASFLKYDTSLFTVVVQLAVFEISLFGCILCCKALALCLFSIVSAAVLDVVPYLAQMFHFLSVVLMRCSVFTLNDIMQRLSFIILVINTM
jgi:hypothetical protein